MFRLQDEHDETTPEGLCGERPPPYFKYNVRCGVLCETGMGSAEYTSVALLFVRHWISAYVALSYTLLFAFGQKNLQ